MARSWPAVVSLHPTFDQHHQRSDLVLFTSANKDNISKRPGRGVRDEEVVGSNPATPTHQQGPDLG